MKNLLRIGVTSLVMAVAPAFANDPMTQSLRGLKGHEFDQAFLSHMIEHHKGAIEMAKLAQHHAQSAEIKKFADKTASKQQKDIDELKKMQGSHHASASSSHSSSHDTSGNVPRSEETSLAVKQAKEGHASSTAHTSDSSLTPTGRDKTSHHASSGHASGSSHHQMQKETMAKLEAAKGAEFDRLFVEEMTKHHQMGIEMAQLAQAQASSKEVKAFAAKTVKEQTKESEELKRLQ